MTATNDSAIRHAYHRATAWKQLRIGMAVISCGFGAWLLNGPIILNQAKAEQAEKTTLTFAMSLLEKMPRIQTPTVHHPVSNAGIPTIDTNTKIMPPPASSIQLPPDITYRIVNGAPFIQSTIDEKSAGGCFTVDLSRPIGPTTSDFAPCERVTETVPHPQWPVLLMITFPLAALAAMLALASLLTGPTGTRYMGFAAIALPFLMMYALNVAAAGVAIAIALYIARSISDKRHSIA